MKKTLLTLISTITLAFTISAQNVNIPDIYFKNYLLANNSINTDVDKLEISFSEANAFNGQIDVSYLSIASLIGIEAFINLTNLVCDFNQLTSLDVTKNTALTELRCGGNNQLKSLNVTNNTALTVLVCNGNQLTSLDVTNNTALTVLICYNNQLTSLDVTKNTALTFLDCYNNLNLKCI